MNVLCAISSHRPSPDMISNAGHDFTRCLRCGADMVSVDGAWTTAPAGQRIVWKAAPVAQPPEETSEFRARSRIDRRAKRFSPDYKGKERRQSQDRRQRSAGARHPPSRTRRPRPDAPPASAGCNQAAIPSAGPRTNRI
jgi:hypothetical protein